MKRMWGFVFLMFLVPSGCGGPAMGTISGKVTVNGKPLQAGMLTFVAENRKSLSTGIKDGQYSVADVPVGKVTVALQETAVSTLKPEDMVKLDPSKMVPAKVSGLVPQKYASSETSGLSLTVTKGVNEFNIDVK